MPRKRLVIALQLVLLGVAVATMALPHGAYAQTASEPPSHADTRYFDVPAGPLDEALNRFAGIAGINLSYDAALLGERQTQGLSGQYAIETALDILLIGTGLRAVPLGDGGYVLRQAPTPASAEQDMELPMLMVEATAMASGITEGTGSYSATGPSATATRLTMSTQETPQSISVVTRQQMDDLGLRDISDVMFFTAGATSTGQDPDGGYAFNIRGFDVANYQVDGLQGSYMPPQRGSFHSVAFDTILYDRIEILRGATGLLSGSGDPSATVNMIRKRPGREFGGEASVAAGSWGQRQLVGDVSIPITRDGGVRARLIGGHREGDSFSDRRSHDELTLSGVLEADIGPSTLLTLGHDFQRSDRKGDANVGLPAFDSAGNLTRLPRSTWIAPSWTYWNKEYQHSFIYLDHAFQNGWTAKAAYSRHENTGDALVVGRGDGRFLQPDGSGLSINTSLVSQSEREQDSYEINTSGPIDVLGRTHELSFGFNGSKATNTAYTMDHDSAGYEYHIPDFPNWDGSGFDKPNVFRTGAFSETTIEESGWFGAARLHLADPLHLIVGARLSSYETYRDDYDTEGTYTATNARLRNSNEFTPYAGITYAFTPEVMAYASYTEIFRPQSYRDKDDNFLDPIVGNNTELGVKTTLLDERLNLNLAVFEARQDNLAEIDPSVPENSLPDGSQAYRSTGEGNTSRGFEIEASGEITPGWNIYAAYTHTNTKDGEGERVNRTIPRDLFKFGTHYRLPGEWSNLGVGGMLQWQGRREMSGEGDTIPGVGYVSPTQSGYTVVNLHANYQFNDHWQANLSVNNAFDETYYDTFSVWGVRYGAPRSALMTLRYRF